MQPCLVVLFVFRRGGAGGFSPGVENDSLQLNAVDDILKSSRKKFFCQLNIERERTFIAASNDQIKPFSNLFPRLKSPFS